MRAREFMNIVENAGADDLGGLVRQVRNSIAPNFRGQCEGAAAELAELLQEKGLQAEFVEGRFDTPWDWGDGTSHPWSPHCWVEINNLILDPSAEQFGDRPLVVRKGSPEAAPYDATPLIEEVSSFVLYHGTSDVSWNEIKRSNEMIRMDSEPAISFTRSKTVAEWFAKDSVERDAIDGAEAGIVIAFDGAKMARDFKLEDHHDPRIDSAPDALKNEEEVRVLGEKIPNVKSYIMGIEVLG